jgi:hypothetical protein
MKKEKYKKSKILSLKIFFKVLMGKRLYCKYVTKKHDMEHVGTYRQGERPYILTVHVRRCKACGSHKKHYV